MAPDAQPKRPRFTGVSLYNHAKGHLSFWYPTEWSLQEVQTPDLTVYLLPDPTDLTTNITIEVKDLLKPLAIEERDLVATGVRSGLEQLQDCEVESWRELDKNEVGDWGLEWFCSFVDTDQRRKRRARLFVSSRFLYSIICQGTTEAHYTYWQGMFGFVMLTVGSNPFSLAKWLKERNPEAKIEGLT